MPRPATLASSIGLLAVTLLLFIAKAADASTFAVDTFVDLPDGNLADGICSWQANPNPEVPTCSLRAAVMQANASPVNPDAPIAAIQLQPGETYYLVGSSDDSDKSGKAGDLDILRPMSVGVEPGLELASIIVSDGTERAFHFLGGAGGSTLFGMELRALGDSGVASLILGEPEAGHLEFENIRLFESENVGMQLMLLRNPSSLIADSEFDNASRALWVRNGVITIARTTMHGDPVGPAVILFDSSATLVSSTFSDNHQHVYALRSNLSIIESTFSGADHVTVKMESEDKSTLLFIRNSLFSSAGAASCSLVDLPPTTNASGNVFDEDGCTSDIAPATPNLQNASIALSPLALHGGKVKTHELLPASDGIDWIPPQFCNPNGTDQRGYPRAVDYSGLQPAHCDAGATELQIAPPPPEGHIFGDGFEGD